MGFKIGSSTEALATIGHELGHLRRQKRFIGEMMAVMGGTVGFVFLFSVAPISFGITSISNLRTNNNCHSNVPAAKSASLA